MAKHKSRWTAPALSLLLISGVTAAVGLTVPTLAHAVKKSLTHVERVNVRADEEKRLAKLDKSYAKQQRKLAQQYRKTARAVEREGGDPTGLLEAAAYFDDKVSNGRSNR